jgi:anti-sigma regulatory factor (Ser/Thr protein kinase)
MRQAWLPAAPEGAPLARALVRDAASELELDGDLTYALCLATTEAFANAVQHGAPCAERGIFVCVEALDEGGVCIEVCDCGACFPENAAISTKPDGEGGRGIPIIASLMDSLEVLPDPGVTRVRFQKLRATA